LNLITEVVVPLLIGLIGPAVYVLLNDLIKRLRNRQRIAIRASRLILKDWKDRIRLGSCKYTLGGIRVEAPVDPAPGLTPEAQAQFRKTFRGIWRSWEEGKRESQARKEEYRGLLESFNETVRRKVLAVWIKETGIPDLGELRDVPPVEMWKRKWVSSNDLQYRAYREAFGEGRGISVAPPATKRSKLFTLQPDDDPSVHIAQAEESELQRLKQLIDGFQMDDETRALVKTIREKGELDERQSQETIGKLKRLINEALLYGTRRG